MAKETYYNLEVETMFANAQASKKPVLEALSDAIITVLTELDALRAALNAALDALREAPDPFAPIFRDGSPSLRALCQEWWAGQRQAALNPTEGE